MFRATIAAALILLAGCSPGTWRLREENDYFTLFNNDHDYTQGLIVEHETDDSLQAVGQQIYTPVHKKESEVVEDERPYAGYLFGSLGKKVPLDESTKFLYGGDLGIVGPPALGKEAQCGVHALLDQACPKGWHNQLHTEPGATMRAGIQYQQASALSFLRGLDTFKAIAEAGNVSTAARLSTETRWGTRDLYYFAGPTFNLVARDIFLDGNTWQDSHSVDKNWWYAQMSGGVGLRLGSVSLIWRLVINSPQFKEQGGSYNYGSVTIQWEN